MRPTVIAARDAARLGTVDPRLADVVDRTLRALDILGHPMTVTAARRTATEQFALYCKGRKLDPATGHWIPINPATRFGIVTNADGATRRSNHQPPAADPLGLGRAVDCAFLVDGPNADGVLETPTWDADHPWTLYGEMVEALGRSLGAGVRVAWGGRWTQPHDAPHAELVIVG